MATDTEKALEEKARGNAAFQSGDFLLAVEHFSKAIGFNPTDKVLYSNRSGAYASLKKFEEALKDAEKCVELDPTWAKVRPNVFEPVAQIIRLPSEFQRILLRRIRSAL